MPLDFRPRWRYVVNKAGAANAAPALKYKFYFTPHFCGYTEFGIVPLVFRAAPVFLPVIPVLVVAGTFAGFGLTERAAVFLPGTIIVGGLAILVHSQPGRAGRIASRKRFRGFRAAWIEGNKRLALIDCFYGIVDAFQIVALVGKEGAFL